jgi:hypothetical protein
VAAQKHEGRKEFTTYIQVALEFFCSVAFNVSFQLKGIHKTLAAVLNVADEWSWAGTS